MVDGYSENVTLDEGVSVDGIRTQLHFQGDQLITQRSYDPTEHLKYAALARQDTDGQCWGEGKLVGHIPPLEYARFLAIKDNKERQKAIKAWLRENSGFVMFDKYLKN